ncbi:DUF3848 domain-containing protein [Eubacterium callanderi]|uniref:DUF3848 domain-containing protein n=1 Tax=Eubacterium callanderi TaxID=53442 RepID=UPI003AEFA7F1
MAMTNEELNTALYKKMFAEQDQFRSILLTKTPGEILNHAYEYVVREDLLMSLENNDLSEGQAKALLKTKQPLDGAFKVWENQETGYMEDIWNTLEKHASAVEQKQRNKKQPER